MTRITTLSGPQTLSTPRHLLPDLQVILYQQELSL